MEGEASERQQPEKQMSIDQVCYNYTDLSEFLPLLPGVEEMALAETYASLCVFSVNQSKKSRVGIRNGA